MTAYTTRPCQAQSLLVGLLAALAASTLQAGELSLAKGFFKSDAIKGGLNSKLLSVGGRYSEQFDPRMYWFGEATLEARNYSAPGTYKPKDGLNLSFGGGVRYYFDRLSDKLAPYAAVSASLLSDYRATGQGGVITEAETAGLYYSAGAGLRLSLSSQFFLDIEGSLFQSPLYARQLTREISEDATGVHISQNEHRQSELFVNSQGTFNNISFAVGMRL